jgi:hypothetical protein
MKPEPRALLSLKKETSEEEEDNFGGKRKRISADERLHKK